MVLHQVSLDMENVISVEGILLDVIGAQLSRSSQVRSKGALAIRRDQHDGTTGHRLLRQQQDGLDSVLDHVFAVEIAHLIIADFTDESRFTT